MKSEIANRQSPTAFTLVELMVVVSIIVLLLSLLAPALNKAVYQAQLASCGAKLKMVGHAVLGYALENRRSYPDRRIEDIQPGGGRQLYLGAMTLAVPLDGYDMRPLLSKIMDVNSALQCPLSPPVELVNTNLNNAQPDAVAEASYAMFWDWKYDTASRTSVNRNNASVNTREAQSHPGMMRLGDRFEWAMENQPIRSYNVLAGDLDLRYPNEAAGAQSAQASHADRAPSLMFPQAAEGEVLFGSRGFMSRWVAPLTVTRGPIDTNFIFDDGAVRRYNDVPNWANTWQDSKDDRMGFVPIQWDNRRDIDRFQIPRQ